MHWQLVLLWLWLCDGALASSLPAAAGPDFCRLSAAFRAPAPAASHTRTMAAAAEAFKSVDLLLPADKQPASAPADVQTVPFTAAVGRLWPRSKHLQTEPREGKRTGPERAPTLTPAVGSTEELVLDGDLGLFGAVFTAWAKHWSLRTGPEDWWLPLVTRVAARVDACAENAAVRKLFVAEQQGKKTLSVEVPSFTIYDTDFAAVFDAFSAAIDANIHVPGYVSAVSSDFSTSSSAQRIASQITLMKSLQKYFDYEMMICGCGLAGLEMLGTERDWAQLGVKLRALRQLLQPVEGVLRLEPVFAKAEEVHEHLLSTFREGAAVSEANRAWWARVLIDDKDIEYGPSGMRQHEVQAYNGWLVAFLTGREKLKARELSRGDYAEQLSCLSSCPLLIKDVVRKLEDKAVLVGGMLGHAYRVQAGRRVAVQPVHGWAMLLPEKSPLRAH